MRLVGYRSSNANIYVRISLTIADMCALLATDVASVRAMHGSALRVNIEHSRRGEFILYVQPDIDDVGYKFTWNMRSSFGSFNIIGHKLGVGLYDDGRIFDVTYTILGPGRLLCTFNRTKAYAVKRIYRPRSKARSGETVLADAVQIINSAAKTGEVELIVRNNQLMVNVKYKEDST